MTTWLITGTSRGLGLATVGRLASLPTSTVSEIFATVRGGKASGELQRLASKHPNRIHIVRLDDTRDQASVAAAATEVARILRSKGRAGLDVLINNAGIVVRDNGNVETVASQDIERVFVTNVAGVHNVTVAFLPLLRKGTTKKICNMTSFLGSIALSAQNPVACVSYKVAKAGLNALTAEYAHQLQSEGLIFLAICPGWLRTDLGGFDAEHPVEYGAEVVVKLIQEAGPERNGCFLAEDGSELPW